MVKFVAQLDVGLSSDDMARRERLARKWGLEAKDLGAFALRITDALISGIASQPDKPQGRVEFFKSDSGRYLKFDPLDLDPDKVWDGAEPVTSTRGSVIAEATYRERINLTEELQGRFVLLRQYLQDRVSSDADIVRYAYQLLEEMTDLRDDGWSLMRVYNQDGTIGDIELGEDSRQNQRA